MRPFFAGQPVENVGPLVDATAGECSAQLVEPSDGARREVAVRDEPADDDPGPRR